MQEELSMIQKNQTWELVERPEHRKVIGVKWMFRTKLNVDDSIDKHKARLVVKGYAQAFGVHFSETFNLFHGWINQIAAGTSCSENGCKVFQLDVKSAFLNGYLQEEIHVQQPEEFVVKGQDNKDYLLEKALHGLN